MPRPPAGLLVSRPNDPHEREAHRLANEAMRAPSPGFERHAWTRQGAAPQGATGQPLSKELRGFFEPRLGHDFGRVRVHAGARAAASARALGARAYAVGSDLVFGDGQLRPDTSEGRLLLAHELAHVAQQPWLPAGLISRQPKPETPLGEVAGVESTVKIKGRPKSHPDYVQNAIGRIGVDILGGPWRLEPRPEAKTKENIYLQRTEVHLYSDPLSADESLEQVYTSRAAADKAVKALTGVVTYSYYLGPGGLIYPTTISDTTAPYLCDTMRQLREQEREHAAASAEFAASLLFWYVGARFPIQTSGPKTGPKTPAPPKTPAATGAAGAGAAGTQAGGAAAKAPVFVEIGAGDLGASIKLAEKGGAKVIAVDPVQPAAEAIKRLESAGGSFVKGVAADLPAGSADHVFQYFPWKITGTGRHAAGGTWRLVDDSIKLLKPGGAAHFATEELATAQYLAKEASSRGFKAAITESTAAAAAPGATGAGVPGMGKSLKVWLVNISK